MKKFTILFTMMVYFAFAAYGKPVNVNTAKTVAKNYFNHQLIKKGDHALTDNNYELVFTQNTVKGIPVYYVFNAMPNAGFIMVAADDASLPVLGYSFHNLYQGENSNHSFAKWVDSYKSAIIFIMDNDIQATKTITNTWNNFIKNRFENTENVTSVDPLCMAMYNQSPYFNDACPFDKEADKNCVTGCPATAMAIIMKYWKHPIQGAGSKSYDAAKYGTLTVNPGNTFFNWDNMPDVVDEANADIAQLLYQCGVTVEMQYTAESSGSYVTEYDGEKASCEYAFKNFFGYAKSLKGVERGDYSDPEWLDLMKSELDSSRPMQYAGFGGGGHTFVCDGYDDNDMFHMNWGWGGEENGFFLLNSLNPGAGGIGSGEGTYNMGQQALVGVKPAITFGSSAPKFGVVLGSDIDVSQQPIQESTPFDVTVDLTYTGSADYTTDLAALVFNDKGVLYDYVDFVEGKTLTNGSTTNFTFSSSGLSAIPGKYTIGIYGSEPNDSIWHLIKQGSFTNPVNVIISGEPNDIKLTSSMKLSKTDVQPNQAFTLTTSLLNLSATDFNGNVVADLFDAQGNSIMTLEEKTGIVIPSGDSISNITFNVPGLDLAPGTYLIALFSSTDMIDYPIIGNDFFDNPVDFDMVEVPLGPDAYEQNNTAASAFNILLTWANDAASWKSVGSNIHIGDDVDHYLLSLAKGYTYEISARVQDDKKSNDGMKYTTDVYFNYDYGSGPSENIDNVLLNNIKLTNGADVNFKVSPTFVGLTGTYLLDLGITRKVIVSTNNVDIDNAFSIYPVPANNYINLDVENPTLQIKNVTISNALGARLKTIQSDQLNLNHNQIEISTLPSGMYTMLIQLDNHQVVKKFVVNK